MNKIEKNSKDIDENDKRVIYEMFYQKIFNIAFVIIKDKYLAQDITQETFIKVSFHSRNDIRGSKVEASSSENKIKRCFSKTIERRLEDVKFKISKRHYLKKEKYISVGF